MRMQLELSLLAALSWPGIEARMPEMKNPGSRPEALKAWRAPRGTTQSDTADRFGSPTQTFYRWEDGESTPAFKSPHIMQALIT